MTLEEAKKIVSKMVCYIMESAGLPKKTNKPITEDIQTLLKANKIVENDNMRKNREQQAGTRHLTLADRQIAALYVAANYEGESTKELTPLADYKDRYVFCISKNSIKEK